MADISNNDLIEEVSKTEEGGWSETSLTEMKMTMYPLKNVLLQFDFSSRPVQAAPHSPAHAQSATAAVVSP